MDTIKDGDVFVLIGLDSKGGHNSIRNVPFLGKEYRGHVNESRASFDFHIHGYTFLGPIDGDITILFGYE